MTKTIENQRFDEERALYGSRGVEVVDCAFDGPADGESAFKESRDVVARLGKLIRDDPDSCATVEVQERLGTVYGVGVGFSAVKRRLEIGLS